MAGRTRRGNGVGSSFTGLGSDDTEPSAATMFGVFRGLMEAQKDQNALFRTGLEQTRETVEAALKRAIDPQEARPGGVSDFRKLQPATFAGTEAPLAADQWLVDMTNLLAAARIPEAEQVEVVKIQLTDLARTWWLAEEETHAKGTQITWEMFTAAFLKRFFPVTAQREMERQFVQLQQGDMSVDVYAAEFLRLSRFALTMVVVEKDKANRFQQGLKLEIQKFIASLSLDTYAKVITAARQTEAVLLREVAQAEAQQVVQGPGKRSFSQTFGSSASQQRPAVQISRPTVPVQRQPYRVPVCGFCHRPGHLQRECRRTGACLICGGVDHMISQCPYRRQPQGYRALVPPTQYRSPAPPQQRAATPYQYRPPAVQSQGQYRPPAGQVVPRAPLLPQATTFQNRPRAPAAGYDRGRGAAFTLTAEQAEFVGDVVTVSGPTSTFCPSNG